MYKQLMGANYADKTKGGSRGTLRGIKNPHANPVKFNVNLMRSMSLTLPLNFLLLASLLLAFFFHLYPRQLGWKEIPLLR